MNKASGIIRFLIYGLTALFVATLAVLVFLNAVLRYVFNSSIVWSPELATFLLIWLVVMGIIINLKDNQHLNVKSFIKKFSPAGKKAVFLFSHILMLIICALLFDGCWRLTLQNLHSKAVSTGLPMVLVYGSVLVMSGGLALVLLMNLYRFILKKNTVDELLGLNDEFDPDSGKKGDALSNS